MTIEELLYEILLQVDALVLEFTGSGEGLYTLVTETFPAFYSAFLVVVGIITTACALYIGKTLISFWLGAWRYATRRN